MNEQRDDAFVPAADAADPLTSLRASVTAIADLAFGSSLETLAPADAGGRHLALLTTATLQLDLDDPAQRQFGDYELLEQIGEGGMGVVYRAHQRSLDREVALKLLAAGPWASSEFIERFRREAQHAARMQHPNIVAIHEVGSVEELQFFSMRLVRGGSLAAMLEKDGVLAPLRAAQMLRTIAEAVDYAHRLGVLHLDLKPGNVLLDEDAAPHVADFGLARRLDSALASGDDEVSGTPSYMAPEQASPRMARITPATDIWGLGAILYELVTGQPPFLGKSPHETLRLVVDGALRNPREIVPELPRDLAAIILKCLAPLAAERYPSARALADDLGRFIDGRAVFARPLNPAQRMARWTKRQPYVAAFAALFALSLIAGIFGVTLQWRQARANATLAQNTLWSSRTANAQRQIAEGDAYKALRETVANLREMEAKGESEQVALQRLRIGTVLANAPQLIDTISLGKEQIPALAVAPDGKSFAAVDNSRTVYLVDVADGSLRWHVDAKPKSFGMFMGDGPLELRFSPDGHCLIGFTKTDYGAAASILRPHHIDSVLIDVDNGRVVEPPAEFADFLATDYADDGRYALLFDKQGYAQRWRTLPWAPAGDRVKLEGNINLDDKKFSALLGEALLAGDDDLVVLASDANLTFRVLDAEHLRVRHTLHLTTAQGRASSWMLDRGHRHLAIGTMTGQIALWNLDTNDVVWLQPHASGWISMLNFSNDDSRLALVSNDPNELRVFDPRSGELVAAPVTLGNDATPGAMNDVEFGPDAYTVLTRRWSTYATLWRLPEPGFPLHAPIAAVPIMVGFGSRFALASDARSHLMVTTDNGLIKLWRVRWSPLADRVAAPMVADTMRFGGQYLVAADGNQVSVFEVESGKTTGTPITLAQAPTYADLSGDGKQVIAIAGRELSCWDWHEATPCWPALSLPDSPLRLGLAANAPLLAVSTGKNENGGFFEHVKLIDLGSGRQRGGDIVLPGRLAALRLSDGGERLLAWRDYMSYDKQSNRLYVIDTATGSVARQLEHEGETSIIDAQFADDGSIWSLAGAFVGGSDDGKEVPYYTRHWDTSGSIVAKTPNSGSEFRLLPLPRNGGVIDTQSLQWFGPAGQERQLDAPQPNGRVNASALSADGRLLALAMLDGVALIDTTSNERLVPNFNLPLPNHDAVQQLAFAPDGSRLVGRTLSGHWFQWRLVADGRPIEAIEQSIQLYDFSDRGLNDKGESAPPLPDPERRLLRSADPGPAPDAAAAAATASVAAPAPDPRYRPLDLDAIANVEPREPMNRVTRIPPQPQSLPTLPRGLQRYDGVDFLLGRAVQLSGAPHNLLDVEFPARTAPLPIGAPRIAAVDVLVLQFKAVNGEIGAVLLHYADGGEAKLSILAGRDTARHWNDEDAAQARVGWMGNFSGAMRGYGYVSGGEETFARSYVVHLTHPEPARAVNAITLDAPPAAAPGLLFLAVTIEPAAEGSEF
jgi:WD40 repeat protein